MKPEAPQHPLIISASPHIHDNSSVQRIMLDVLIALTPAFLASCWFFRLDALRLTAACVGTALLSEWLCRKAMRRDTSLNDFSAAVTGLLLAFNLPPDLPTWMAVVGSLFAVVVAKQVFGGLGYNPFNPALAARAFMLISFTGAMTTWSESAWTEKLRYVAEHATTQATSLATDALTSPTPLGYAKAAMKAGETLPLFDTALLTDFFLGQINGCLGETSALALLIGSLYLLWRRVITWHIPTAYLLTVLLYALALRLFTPSSALPPLVHLLSGGLFLGALFMATDMVTSPITPRGMLLFGAGCGVLTMLIRTVRSGAYPEGVSFAILIMNAFTPLINRATRNRVFGSGKTKRTP